MSHFFKCDGTLKGFPFALKKPHNRSPMMFTLNAERKEHVLFCSSAIGPALGQDIEISNHYNTNEDNHTGFGHSYLHTTRLDPQMFFTRALHFTVKEIEVFEIDAL
jgi:hypothetical protein